MNPILQDPRKAKRLRQLAGGNTAYADVFAFLAGLKNKHRRTDIQSVARLSRVPLTEAVGLFRELDEIGAGKFVLGRRGYPTRFMWDWRHVPSHALASIALGQAQPEDFAKQDDASAEVDEPQDLLDEDTVEPETILERTHRFHLREDYEARLVTPLDITAKEIAELARWVSTLKPLKPRA